MNTDRTRQWVVIWDSSIKGKNSAAVCMIFEDEQAAASCLKTQSDFEPNANVRMFPVFIPWPHPILGSEAPKELDTAIKNMKWQIDALSEKLRELGVDPSEFLVNDAPY